MRGKGFCWQDQGCALATTENLPSSNMTSDAAAPCRMPDLIRLHLKLRAHQTFLQALYFLSKVGILFIQKPHFLCLFFLQRLLADGECTALLSNVFPELA